MGLSVGQATALALTLERAYGEIRLADFDYLDLSNLNRLRTGVHNLGLPKAYQAAREIAEIDPFLRVRCFADGLRGDDYSEFLTGGGKLDLLIEECDSIDVKIRVRQEARRRGIPVVMDTGDRGMLDIERFDLEPERPIFHGMIGEIDPARLAGLTTEEKLPYVLKIIGADKISTRLRASLLEVESSISTWPQLGSAVHLGAALAADTSRRILLGQCRISGRFYADLHAIVPDSAGPRAEPDREWPPAPISVEEMGEQASAVQLPASTGGVDVERLVADAILAPSGGNCQPWLWFWDGRLHLFLDRARGHSLLDYRYLGAIASLGAACENLRLSAGHQGFPVEEALFPNGEQGDLAASFSFRKTAEQAVDPLYAAVAVRHTNRRLEGRQPLLDGEMDRLGSVARAEGAEIRWLIENEPLEEIGRLLGEGDRLRFLHEELHRQLMSELRFTPAEAAATGDGIALDTLELGEGDLAGIDLSRSWEALALVRKWGGGANLTKMARKTIGSASAVGLLLMPEVSPSAFLRGGRAFQRVWLTAANLGIAVQPMTALPYLFMRLQHGGGEGLDEFVTSELARLRPRYESVFGIDGRLAEVMLFRLSIAGAPEKRAARRPLADCLFGLAGKGGLQYGKT